MNTFHEEEILGKAYDSRLMKRLLRYMIPYKWQVVLALIIMLCATATELIMPYLTKIALDQYIIPGDTRGLHRLIFVMLGIMALGFGFQLSEVYVLQWIGQHVLYDLRMKLFSHLQNLSLAFFDRNPVGRLVTRVTTDVETLNELFSAGIVAIFGDIFMLTGIIIVLLKIHTKMALLTFSVIPLLALVTILFRKYVRDAFREVRIRIARINSYLQENISGMLIVQLFNRERKNYKKFDQLNADHLQAYIRTIIYFAIFFPIVELISAVAVALIVWYGGLNYYSGTVTFGTLVAFIQYARRFFRPISDLSEKYNILQSAMASSERIFKILDTEPGVKNADHPVKVINFRGHIEFRNVWFSYSDDEEWVLKDVSFHVYPGEKIAFVGATGAGKTTIISLLCRFYDVQQGVILIDGVDIREYDIQFLRSHFGIVLQDVFLFAGDIESNIRLSNENMPMEQIIQAARDVNLDRFIRQLPNKYKEEVTERGSTLSMGQRQLLSFARALASDPTILILDEATSSVDTETELLIQDALKKLMANRTSIVIAHRLSTIVNSDRIIVMHHGRIREVGNHHELLKMKGIYHRLYQLQYASERRFAAS